MAIFLLGLRLLTNVLETVLGFRLHTALNRFTASRAQSFLVGFAVTAFIQSSSAVGAAMVVLTDTGVLSLTQALGVMLGANVGTTITAQIIALPLEDMALPLCAAGLAVRFFFRRRRAGAAIFSLGRSSSVSPVRPISLALSSSCPPSMLSWPLARKPLAERFCAGLY